MNRRPSPARLAGLIVVSALVAVACSTAPPEELAARYRVEDGALLPSNTLAPPETSGDDQAADAGPAATPAGATSPDGRPPRDQPLRAATARCPFDTTGFDVECGEIEIPGRDTIDSIEITFARFSAEGTAAADPVIYLHGGPGGAILESADRFYGAVVAPFIADRDVILYDQRGAGESSPLPVCTEAWALDLDFFGEPTLHADLRTDYRTALLDCAERVQRRADIDLSAYGSAVHADDLLDLIGALGYQRVNLYGVSYGSRLAQTMMRDHPEPIRSVIVSGVYPIEENLIGSTPAAFEQALDLVFEGCAAEPACADHLPDPHASLASRVSQLDDEPHVVELPFDESSSYTFAVAGDDLLNILHGLLYSADGAALIPDLLIDLEAGDTDRLTRLAVDGVYDTADVAAYLGVQCREEVPFTTPQELEAASRLESIFDRINLPPGLLSNDLVEICAGWHEIGVAPPIENEPATWSQPTLVMAGGFDPITPPEWGVALAERLPDSTLAYSASRGHDADEGECAAGLMTAFIADPAAELDTSCTEEEPLPRLMNTNVHVFERNGIELTDSIFDIDPGPDVEWIDMRLPDWSADFYEDEEVYWRNVDVADPTVLIVRAGAFDPTEITWYLPFDVVDPTFTQTDVPDEVAAGWTRWVFETVGQDIVTYISDGSPEMNVSVVAADGDIDVLEKTAIIAMINSVAIG